MAATARVVDLTDMKEGGNFRPRRKPEGDYRAKIVKADDHESKDKTKPLGWVLTIMVEGDARSTYPYYLSPDKKSAWKIGAICRAAGLNVKNARLKFDPNKLVNKGIGVALADDEFEGRLKSTIDDVFPRSEVGANADEDAPEDIDEIEDEVEVPDDEDVEEEEEEPAPPPRRRHKPIPRDLPEDGEDGEEEEEEPPTKTVRRRKPAPEPEPEDEEEEEPALPPSKRAPAAAPKRRRPTPPPEDEDELDTDDLDD